MRRRMGLGLLFRATVLGLLLPGLAVTAHAGRCGTGRHSGDVARFNPPPPVARGAAPAAHRTATPVSTNDANVHTTEHFRVLWGTGHSGPLVRWQDPEGDGVPAWVEVLGQALEDAYGVQTGLGFPHPYGVDSCGADPAGGCYIEAYVGNTGVVTDGQSVTIGSSFYAYTEIDTDSEVAFFVFNFSAIGSEDVLRATAAHELFHAVQRAMGYPWNAAGPWDAREYISDARWGEEGWWLEATATWVEEVSFPEVDDYISYVNGFLAEPHVALHSLDGLHEYGAALFAGYVWGLYGGADLFRETYENAYALELEPALRSALSARGAGQLEDVVAAFWAQAAEPNPAIWPDAGQFQAAVPLTTVTSVPVTVVPAASARPGRFGANVIRMVAGTLPATVGMEELHPAAVWRLAARAGPGAAVAIVNPAQASVVEIDGDASNGFAALAVVNASPGGGSQHYTAEFVGDGAVAAPSRSGGGDGGCFLGSLGR